MFPLMWSVSKHCRRQEMPDDRAETHPLFYVAQLLQQHINRGLKRHALMTGRHAPSDAELKRNIHKRMLAAENAAPASRSRLGKRFNRHGVPSSRPTKADIAEAKALNLKGNKKGHG